MIRKFNYFIVLLLCYITGCSSFPYNSFVTTEALQAATAKCDYILAQETKQADGNIHFHSYYELSGTREFSDMFNFEEWSISSIAPQGSPLLVLRFSKAWILEIYADGTALAHNGYASSYTKPDCYYSLPTIELHTIIRYIEENAIRHSLGDGAIFATTFHK